MGKHSKAKKLSSMQLFYEEIPYKISPRSSKKRAKRIRRKSKSKQNNLFED